MVLDAWMAGGREQASATAMSSASQLDTQLIAEGLAQGSGGNWKGMVLLTGVSLLVLAAALLAQAWVMSRRRPRKLMEG